MNKNKLQKIIAIVLLSLFALSLIGCTVKKKTVNAKIMVEEKTNKVSHYIHNVTLGEGEHFDNLKIISIDKDTVTYSFNLEEKTVKYGEIETFYIVAYDYGTYNYQITITKEE